MDPSCAQEPQLLAAFESGDFQTALQLLPKDGPPIVYGPEGFTPLHYACRHGDAEAVRLLITEYNYNIKSYTQAGLTPVHIAAQYGHTDTLRALVECSESFGQEREVVSSSLSNNSATNLDSLATSFDDTNMFVPAVTKPPNTVLVCTTQNGGTPLHTAAKAGCLEVVRYLVEEHGCPTSPIDEQGRTPLYVAAGSGQLEVVKYFTQNMKCDPNIGTTIDNINLEVYIIHGTTKFWKAANFSYAPGMVPLHSASEGGHLDIVEYLVTELKCDPSCTNDDGDTPLHLAALNGHLDTVKYFTSHEQSDPSHGNKAGQTPLHLASLCGHLSVVQLLVESGCSPVVRAVNGRIPLHYASLNGHLDIVKYFGIEHHVNISRRDKKGVTPLHMAAFNGHLSVVQFLVESGCDPMVREANEWTPLYYASQNGHLDIVKYFNRCNGLDSSCQDKHDITPLHLATLNGHLPVVQFLVESGCDPMVIIVDGWTLLHYASQHGHFETLKYLINVHQLDPSSQDKNGDTPLHLAALNGHLPVVQFLVESGCDPMVTDVNGWTPLHCACYNGNLDIVKYFASVKQYNFSCRNKEHLVPLHIAARNGHLPVVQFLVESGCDPMVRDIVDLTPLHYASSQGHFDIVKYFTTDDRVDPSCQAKFGITPLHMASNNGHLPVVQHFVQDKGCDPSLAAFSMPWLGIKCSAISLASARAQWDVVMYLCSKGERLPNEELAKTFGLNIKEDVFKSTMFTKYEKLLQHSELPSTPIKNASFMIRPQPLRPLSLLVKVYLVGNQSSGKSSLVKALSAESSWLGRYRNVAGVVPKTAGIIPSEFDSVHYGKVTFYDFAGHPEYYASHELVFENRSRPVVIVVVDLSKDNATIGKTLRYWLQFLHTSISAAGSQALRVILVGSHADLVQPQHLISKTALLKAFDSSATLIVVGTCVLDCRKSASGGMSHLHNLLRRSCKTIRIQSDFDYQNGRLLNLFISNHLSHIAACTFKKLLDIIMRNHDPELQAMKSPDILFQTCESLNISGHLVLLKNNRIIEKSWLIFKKEVIFTDVNGLLKHLQQCAPLGIVPLSLLRSTLDEHVQDLPPDLAIRFMKSMLFCSELNSQALSLITNCHPATANKRDNYLFFPSLVSTEKPAHICDWSPDPTYPYMCGWHLKCTNMGQFFTPRFLQVLQMELACRYALHVHPSSPGVLKPQRGCHLWINGIRWLSDGIEVVVHVSNEERVVGLMLRCLKHHEMECIRLRSTLIQEVLSIKGRYLNNFPTNEYLIHPQYLRTSSVPEYAMFSLTEVASCIIQQKDTIPLDHLNFTSSFLVVQEFLYFEPYEKMGRALVHRLFDPRNSSKPIEPHILNMLAQAMQEKWKQTGEALHIPSHILAAIEKESSIDFEKCVKVLKEWSRKEGTYSALHRDLGRYSIFCERNPLDTPGLLPMSPIAIDNPHFAIDDVSEEKRASLQKKPELHQLQCMYPEGDRSKTPVRVLDIVSPKWDVLAISFRFKEHVIETVRRNHPNDCEGACRDMFGRWLAGRHCTWETLIRSLYEADATLKTLADQLVNMLCTGVGAGAGQAEEFEVADLDAQATTDRDVEDGEGV